MSQNIQVLGADSIKKPTAEYFNLLTSTCNQKIPKGNIEIGKIWYSSINIIFEWNWIHGWWIH